MKVANGDDSLRSCPWFSDLNHIECEQKLTTFSAQQGDFIVSPSETAVGSYRLSVRTNEPTQPVKHHRLNFNNTPSGGKYFLEAGKEFSSVPELIRHYVSTATFGLRQTFGGGIYEETSIYQTVAPTVI